MSWQPLCLAGRTHTLHKANHTRCAAWSRAQGRHLSAEVLQGRGWGTGDRHRRNDTEGRGGEAQGHGEEWRGDMAGVRQAQGIGEVGRSSASPSLDSCPRFSEGLERHKK